MVIIKILLRRNTVAHRAYSRCIYNVCPSPIFWINFAHFIGSVYWMAGLAPDAAHFFKFLFVLVLFTFAMTLFVSLDLDNLLLG
jgi:hypothetical protein